MADVVTADLPRKPRCPKCGEWRWLVPPGGPGNPFSRMTWCTICRSASEHVRQFGKPRKYEFDFDPEDL